MGRTYAGIFLGLLAGILLCVGANEYSSGRQEALPEVIKELAPTSGTGVKRYYFSSGELKEETHWKNFDIVKIVYYRKNGKPVFVCRPDQRRTLQVVLDDTGGISEIIQSVNFVKDGHCFVLEKGVLRKVQVFKDGEVVSEVVLP